MRLTDIDVPKNYMYLLLFLIFLFACSSNSSQDQWKNFEGRLKGTAIYHAKTPSHWKEILSESSDYLTDTMQPIFTFKIDEDIVLTIHNFPTQSIEESVPANLQVQRWYNQLQSIDPLSLNTQQIAHGGFVGYCFEASGLMKGKETSILAIAMQIIPEHFRSLSHHPLKEPEYRQMRADYTIKAIGTSAAIAKNREDILQFAESFELIQPIPARK